MAKKVLVTGGAGYIGCILVPKLLAKGYQVTVIDALWFGREAFDEAAPGATLVEGDIRDHGRVSSLLREGGFDAVIHLAAVSNDPCSDLDAELTRSVNLDATNHLMREAKSAGVSRFVNASSASVYGIKEELDVTEDLALDPLTLYARYKAETEIVLEELCDDKFVGVSLRAATVCGFSPRLRLDLTINILTYHALTRGEIRVFGGEQRRPNIHIQDLTDFYITLLEAPAEVVQGRAFNVVTENHTVMAIAEMIRDELTKAEEGPDLSIRVVPTEDNRSYHLSANKARDELGFAPKHPLSQTIDELRQAFANGRIADPHDIQYRNVEVMKLHPERTSWKG